MPNHKPILYNLLLCVLYFHTPSSRDKPSSILEKKSFFLSLVDITEKGKCYNWGLFARERLFVLSENKKEKKNYKNESITHISCHFCLEGI